MDYTKELVETLKAGHRVKLVLTPNEPVQNAHALFNRLEREHGLTIGRMPTITAEGLAFVLWAEVPEVVGY